MAKVNLVNYWEEDISKKYPKNNLIENNIFLNIEKLIDGDAKWMTWKNNKVLTESSFWNEKEQKFVLQNGYIKFDDLSGFMPINFDEIGCNIKK